MNTSEEMNKLGILGHGLYVLGSIMMVTSVLAWVVASGVCLVWPPTRGEFLELQLHAICMMVVSMVLSFSGYVLYRVSEKKGE